MTTTAAAVLVLLVLQWVAWRSAYRSFDGSSRRSSCAHDNLHFSSRSYFLFFPLLAPRTAYTTNRRPVNAHQNSNKTTKKRFHFSLFVDIDFKVCFLKRDNFGELRLRSCADCQTQSPPPKMPSWPLRSLAFWMAKKYNIKYGVLTCQTLSFLILPVALPTRTHKHNPSRAAHSLPHRVFPALQV